MALPSFLSATLPDSLAPSFQQILILLAFFAVVALAARFSITTVYGSKHFRGPNGLATFARFFYASFLKPHSGDGAITGQQAALESFYKAQVASPFPILEILNESGANIFRRLFITTSCFICHHENG